MKQRKDWRMSCDVGKATEGLENVLWLGEVTERLENVQRLGCFTYITVHSPTLLSLLLRHKSSSLNSPGELCSFSNPSVASPTSRFILQPFLRFSYVTSSSLNSPGELCSFSNISVTSPTSQLILQPFRRFTYVTAHSTTLLSLHLRHSSFCNPSFASRTSQDFHLRHLASRP